MPNFQDNDFTLVSSADNTKHARFSANSIAAGNERIIIFPDGGGKLAVLDGAGTQFFVQQTNFQSAAFAPNALVVAKDNTFDTSADIYIDYPIVAPAGTITARLQRNAGTFNMVVAIASATVDKTAQTASIGATTAYTTVHAGLYRMSAYAVFTAVTTPGNLTISAIYTDPQQAQTVSFNRNNTLAYTVAGSHVEGELTFYSTTASLIRFSTTLTGIGTYNVYFRVESLT